MKTIHKILTPDLISSAISAGIGLGETFQVSLHDDGHYSIIGLRRTKEFVGEWKQCFENGRKPSRNRAYLGIQHSNGVCLIEI